MADETPATRAEHEVGLAPEFPNNSRRRIAASVYLVLAVLSLVAYLLGRSSSTLVNRGMLWAAIVLGLVAAMSFASGWRMRVDERQALAAAAAALEMPLGHAAAQQVWRGVRSRPTWRILAYSTEVPPHRRALVLVDAIDGSVVEQMVLDVPPEERESLRAALVDGRVVGRAER